MFLLIYLFIYLVWWVRRENVAVSQPSWKFIIYVLEKFFFFLICKTTQATWIFPSFNTFSLNLNIRMLQNVL